MIKLLVIFCCAIAMPACSSLNTVKPWDKDILARPEMSLTDSLTGDALDAHIYFSKEGSTGGSGMGGGGCGCN
jgi:hypothetical protein